MTMHKYLRPISTAILVYVAAFPLAGQAPQNAADGGGASGAEIAEMAASVADSKAIPTVTCKDAELYIDAESATLGTILNRLRDCVGARIDVPPAAAEVKIYDKLGPGPAAQVLESLLSATGFNFVIQESSGSPRKIESIVLLAQANDASRDGDSSQGHGLTNTRKIFNEIRQNPRSSGLEAPTNAAAPAPVASVTTDENAPVPSDPASTAPADSVNNPASQPATEPDSGAMPAAEVPSVLGQPQGEPQPKLEAAPVSSPTGSTQERINYMQQLFEQRRNQVEQQNLQNKQ